MLGLRWTETSGLNYGIVLHSVNLSLCESSWLYDVCLGVIVLSMSPVFCSITCILHDFILLVFRAI